MCIRDRLYFKGIVRVSVIHMLLSLVASLVLLAVLLERALAGTGRAGAAAALIFLLGATGALAAARGALLPRIAGRTTFAQALLAPPGIPVCPAPAGLPSIRCLLLDDSRLAAARFAADHTSPGERIFVGLTRHDKILVNDVFLYFAAGRLPATHWEQFDPGLQTSARIQSQMVEELQSQRVRCVILESTWDRAEEPNESARSSGVHLLDTYIRRHYRLVRRYGDVYVLLRQAPA